MKKLSALLSLIALLCGLAATTLTTTGCKTTSTQVVTNGVTNTVTSTTVDPAVVAVATTTAKSAAYLGTTIYLNGLPPRLPGHPQDRPAFETARTSIQALIAAGSFSAAQLTAALQALPIQELQGEQGTLVVGEAVVLWDSYGRQLASLDKAQVFAGFILPMAQAILDGLNMALGPATTTTTTTAAPAPAK